MPVEAISAAIKEVLFSCNHEQLGHYLNQAGTYSSEMAGQLATEVQLEATAIKLLAEAALFPALHPLLEDVLRYYAVQTVGGDSEAESCKSFELLAWKKPHEFANTVRLMGQNR